MTVIAIETDHDQTILAKLWPPTHAVFTRGGGRPIAYATDADTAKAIDAKVANPSNEPQTIEIGRIEYHRLGTVIEDSGESAFDLYGTSAHVTTEDLEMHFPATRCHHEHDCCGQWYNRRGYFVTKPNEAYQIIRVDAYRNV